MRTVTDEQREAYMTGAQKYLTLRFSDGTILSGEGVNSPINEGSMTLEQTLCDEEQIHFGLCNAASFSVQIVAEDKRYKGLFVYPTITSNDVSFTLGKFRIENDELTDDRYYRTLTCYDQMTDLMNDDVSNWYADLTFPMTLKQFRNSLFTYFNNKYGVSQAPIHIQGQLVANLPNDDMMVDRTLDFQGEIAGDMNFTTSMNGQLMLERICEINGCFGCINEDGQFEYRFLTYDEQLYPADDLYPANDLYPIGGVETFGGDPDDVEANYIQASLVWQEYNYQPITRVQIHQTENDIGAVVGESGNDYEVYDNFLVYGMDAAPLETVATNLLNVLKKTISYTPARIAVRGRPWIQTGDLLEAVCRGQTICFPLLHRTMSGITALKDEYEAQGKEYYDFEVTGVNHEIYGVLRKTYEITKTVNGLNAVATLNSDNYSRLWQTATEVGVEVTGKIDRAYLCAMINKDDTSDITISASRINLDGYVTFENLAHNNGKTVIDGGNIRTGTISGDRIYGGVIRGIYGSDNMSLSAIDGRNGEYFGQRFCVCGSADTLGDFTIPNNPVIDIHGRSGGGGRIDFTNIFTSASSGIIQSGDWTYDGVQENYLFFGFPDSNDSQGKGMFFGSNGNLYITPSNSISPRKAKSESFDVVDTNGVTHTLFFVNGISVV